VVEFEIYGPSLNLGCSLGSESEIYNGRPLQSGSLVAQTENSGESSGFSGCEWFYNVLSWKLTYFSDYQF